MHAMALLVKLEVHFSFKKTCNQIDYSVNTHVQGKREKQSAYISKIVVT